MNGLILGIDVCNEFSHLSYFDKSKNLPESVPFIGNVTILENPKRLDDIFGGSSIGEDVDELVSLLGYIVEVARKYCGCREIDRICITTAHFDITTLDKFKAACIKLGGDMEKIEFISHEECFAYYAFNMHRDLWVNGVVLLDYSSDGLSSCRMKLVNVKGTDVIAETDASKCDDIRLINLLRGGNDAAGLDSVSDILVDSALRVIGNMATSSVYLTGAGFDTKTLPKEFLKCICNKHRVFAGQNLYVKGACLCAYESEFQSKGMLVACHNRLPATIETDIVERGRKKIFRVAQAGVNWYSASRSVDFIVDGCSGMTLHIHPAGGQKPYDEVIEFTDFPYREGKTSRINVLFEFTGDDRCNITIKDKGFGEFVKSSGKVVYRTIEL